MAEQLPFELQKLPPSALEVLRFFGDNGNQPADDVDIMEATNISERSFSKAIKRLVTKKFAEMDADRCYKLTDKGLELVKELLAYDAANGGARRAFADDDDDNGNPFGSSADPVSRRMTVVVPEVFVAGETTPVHIGIDDGLPTGSADLIVRLSCLNATPESQEKILRVGSSASVASFEVLPGEFNVLRLRVQAYQADDYSGALNTAGGMYVDVDITANENERGQLAAYGTDVTVQP